MTRLKPFFVVRTYSCLLIDFEFNLKHAVHELKKQSFGEIQNDKILDGILCNWRPALAQNGRSVETKSSTRWMIVRRADLKARNDHINFISHLA